MSAYETPLRANQRVLFSPILRRADNTSEDSPTSVMGQPTSPSDLPPGQENATPTTIVLGEERATWGDNLGSIDDLFDRVFFGLDDCERLLGSHWLDDGVAAHFYRRLLKTKAMADAISARLGEVADDVSSRVDVTRDTLLQITPGYEMDELGRLDVDFYKTVEVFNVDEELNDDETLIPIDLNTMEV